MQPPHSGLSLAAQEKSQRRVSLEHGTSQAALGGDSLQTPPHAPSRKTRKPELQARGRCVLGPLQAQRSPKQGEGKEGAGLSGVLQREPRSQ